MDLCQNCRVFDVQVFARDQPTYRGYPIHELAHAAETGCSFCSLIVENVLAITNEGDSRDGNLLRQALSQKPVTPLPARSYLAGQLESVWLRMFNLLFPTWLHMAVVRSEIETGPAREGLGLVAIKAFLSTSTDPSAPNIQRSGTVRVNVMADQDTLAHSSGDVVGRLYAQESTWSTSHLEALKAWRQHCALNHPECSRTFSDTQGLDAEDAPLPTRCLEVTMNETQPGQPLYTYRLQRTAGQTGKYVALSHRWGSDTAACSTKKCSLNCFEGACDHTCKRCRGHVPSITKLFQDFAKLSVNIGINFVWIDSLCIIQDDAEDWARESVKMAEYYQNAWLTISATTLSTDRGLFGPISAEYSPRISRLPYRKKDGSQRGHFYTQCLEEVFLSGDYAKDIRKSELLRRGWVFQEWMLSRRLLSFSRAGGLFVQCQRETPHSLYGDPVKSDTSRSVAFKNDVGIDMSNVDSIHESWLRVAEIYSGLELTRLEEDRLVALSGLAKEFAEAIRQSSRDLPCRYISGLWFQRLRGLLWEQVTPGQKRRVRGIPTWSWASMAVPLKDGEEQIQSDGNGRELLSGMPVRWEAGTRGRMVSLAIMEQARMVEVAGGNLQPKHDFQRAISPAPEMPGEIVQTNRFFTIRIKAKLLPVLVHGRFQHEGDANAAANLTDHETDVGRSMWRKVTVPLEPKFVTGWASLEHPEHQNDDSASQSVPFRALVLGKSSKDWGGYGVRKFWGHQTVFAVIFLQPVIVPDSDGCYERVGTGRLFGGQVEIMFERMEEEYVWLV